MGILKTSSAVRFSTFFIFFIISFLQSNHAAAATDGETDAPASNKRDESPPDNVTVMKFDPYLEQRFDDLKALFRTKGVDEVVQTIDNDISLSDEHLKRWQQFVESQTVRVVAVDVHPTEQKAIEWVNKRLERMGLSNLRFDGVESAAAVDPSTPQDDVIKNKKRLRYSAGPGVAIGAAALQIYGLPQDDVTNYFYLIIPSAAVGVTTVLLEWQFANPWLNTVFWTKVWRLGGPVGGRFVNIIVNFLYGMALYGAGVGGSFLPVLFGSDPVHYTDLGFQEAVVAAFTGGVIFHLAMGQFQTDIALEVERGSLSGLSRYGLETTGVVVNNSARVGGWLGLGNLGTWAQLSFFLLKTLPQLIKTNFQPAFQDRDIRARLRPKESAPGVIHKCAKAFAELRLVNLPTITRK